MDDRVRDNNFGVAFIDGGTPCRGLDQSEGLSSSEYEYSLVNDKMLFSLTEKCISITCLVIDHKM